MFLRATLGPRRSGAAEVDVAPNDRYEVIGAELAEGTFVGTKLANKALAPTSLNDDYSDRWMPVEHLVQAG